MKSLVCTLCVALMAVTAISTSSAAEPLNALLIDGQNNHNWQETTPLIKQILEGSGRFTVDVATTPPVGGDMSQFDPSFQDYDVVVSNYNGQPWSPQTQENFEQYVASGGGFVAVHAADNAFPGWDAYNRMIGLGGWGGRDESDGPYVRWKEEQKKFTRDMSPGPGGSHGQRVPFMVVVRDRQHPITDGLPGSFMQVEDELYAQLRGPAENMHVLATGYSEPSTSGSGEHEPLLMTIHYGKGHVFHTTLGHDATAMSGIAFQVTLQRGAEWAATGEVTLPPVDQQTLTSDAPATRDPSTIGKGSSEKTAMPDIEGDGWVSLFNGNDLSGWSQKNGTATYRVEEGAIVGKTAQGSPNSFLSTVNDYGDFELTFEVDVDSGLNSGVQIRSGTKPESGRVYGPQVEIESSPGEAGYIYGEATGRGWISQQRSIKDAYKNDQWNRYVVRAQGDRIQTWVNGRAIADLVDPESRRSGFIGLQVHSIGKDTGPFEVRWRDIRVRELK